MEHMSSIFICLHYELCTFHLNIISCKLFKRLKNDYERKLILPTMSIKKLFELNEADFDTRKITSSTHRCS